MGTVIAAGIGLTVLCLAAMLGWLISGTVGLLRRRQGSSARLIQLWALWGLLVAFHEWVFLFALGQLAR